MNGGSMLSPMQVSHTQQHTILQISNCWINYSIDKRVNGAGSKVNMNTHYFRNTNVLNV